MTGWLWLLAGLAVGMALGYWLGKVRFQQDGEKCKTELALVHRQLDDVRTSETTLRSELDEARQTKTRLETLLNEAKKQEEYFEALGQKTLKILKDELEESATKEYAEKQARLNEKITELLSPLQKLIKENEEKVENLEKQHLKETTALQKHIEMLVEKTGDLVAVKDRLAEALSNSKGRGDWGEMELIRLLEESGLQRGYHYEAQQMTGGMRPDITIKLSNRRLLYIDAKTIMVNLERLFAADGDNDPETVAKERKKHADALEKEVLSLNVKAYEAQADNSIDFVVLYVPRESMLRVALEEKPALMEAAFRKRIILASPLVLMSILKVVAYGWDQVQLSQNAQLIQAMGRELHKRAARFAERFVTLGERLEMTAAQYEDARIALTGRQGMMPQLRKFEDLGCKSEKALPEAMRADGEGDCEDLADDAAGESLQSELMST